MEGLAQDFLEIQAPQGTRNLPTISAQPNVNKTSNSAINQCSPYTPPSQVGADIRFYHRLGCCGNFYHKVDFCGNRMSIFCGGRIFPKPALSVATAGHAPLGRPRGQGGGGLRALMSKWAAKLKRGIGIARSTCGAPCSQRAQRTKEGRRKRRRGAGNAAVWPASGRR